MEDLQTTEHTNERNDERLGEGTDVRELASGGVTLHVIRIGCGV